MSGWFLGRWLAIKGSGWFSPSAPGGVFPFPETWQGWLTFGAFIVALAASGLVHGELIALGRIGLSILYIVFGFITYA